jgi:hypothetical protein
MLLRPKVKTTILAEGATAEGAKYVEIGAE